MSKVHITKLGIVSALGFGVKENLEALLSEKSGIGQIEYLETHHKGKLLAAEVKITNKHLKEILNLKGNFSRTALLGIMAAREAFQTDYSNLKTGLISATSVGGMDRTEVFYQNYLSNQTSGNLGNIRSHDCGDSTEKIANDLGISGFVTTVSTACSSAANAIMMGARMIKSGRFDRVLVGGTDALTRFTLNGFNSLKIVSDKPCRPFDEKRKGLNLGEGAAYLLLESNHALKISQNKSLATVSGYGNTNDAFHQTASSPEGIGATNAMKQALKIAKMEASEINYINAHGTATPNNDQSEAQAFLNVFGENPPYFSSTKSYTGHTLAAAGALEAVFSILALQNQFLPPNLNFETPIEGLNIQPITLLKRNINLATVLSNSFGFGGNCTSLIFKK